MPNNADGTASAAATAALMGQSAPTTQPISTPAPQVTASPSAPASAQANVTPETTATPTVQAPVKGQAEPAISDEQLLAAVVAAESPAMKLSRIEREYGASSKEARRLADYVKKAREILDEQGISITEDDQKLPAGLLPNKKYTKDAGELGIKFEDLPEKTQELFVEKPQAAIDFLIDKAKRALTKVSPTLEQAPTPSVSPERHETAISYLAEAKRETGDLQFPGLAENRKLIEQSLAAPSASKALLDFYKQAPEEAIAMLHLKFEHARSFLRDQATKIALAAQAKSDAANANPTNAPTGGGTASIGTVSSTGNAYADSLLKQMQELRSERDRK